MEDVQAVQTAIDLLLGDNAVSGSPPEFSSSEFRTLVLEFLAEIRADYVRWGLEDESDYDNVWMQDGDFENAFVVGISLTPEWVNVCAGRGHSQEIRRCDFFSDLVATAKMANPPLTIPRDVFDRWLSLDAE